jgi:FdhD protein
MTDEAMPVVEEVPVRLVAGGETLYEWRCTPTELTALVVGRLYADALINNGDIAAQLHSSRVGDDIAIVLSSHVASQHIMRARVSPVTIPSHEEFAELFRALFAHVDEKHEHGGMHAAALARDGRIAFVAEDVGRHNAVDKVIGMAVLAGADLAAHGMLVSARVSGEIARKAARCAVKWLASRSLPTTLAVQTAQMGGMPIIGRAAGRNAYIYQ